MKLFQRAFGLLVTLISIIFLYLAVVYPSFPLNTDLSIILWGYLLTLFLPGLVIDLIFGEIGKESGEDIGVRCGGLRYGGYLIGCIERSLIYLTIVIVYFDGALSYSSILSFLSVIIAGKAIFRYSSRDSSRESNDRSCADWYILGTFMSITMALALSWWIFRFLLTG
jgi:hypothetical protein